jgi:phage gp46-like protein
MTSPFTTTDGAALLTDLAPANSLQLGSAGGWEYWADSARGTAAGATAWQLTRRNTTTGSVESYPAAAVLPASAAAAAALPLWPNFGF